MELPIRVSNLSSRTNVIPERAVLCEIQPVDLADFPTTNSVDSTDENDFPSKFDMTGIKLKPETELELLLNWRDIFSQHDLDLGHTKLAKHRIDLIDETPFKQRYRHIPPTMYDEVKNHLQQLLDCGVIRKSHSPWASNIVLVRKKCGALRICIDYRQLNKRTIKDSYALPYIEELLDCLSGSKYFSVLDMKSGYHQVEIEEEHKPRTAFTVGPLGFWEMNHLAFGLCNAPSTYQRIMEECLVDLNHQICLIYLDNLIIFSTTVELKSLLASPPILGYAQYGKPFFLHNDASHEGLGAVLYQDQQGHKRVTAYASRGLYQSERNYAAHKLEFLALK